MDVLYYPLIYHEFNALTPKETCLQMFLPADMNLIARWQKYIKIPADVNGYIRNMIDYIYTAPVYDEELLMKHNNAALNLSIIGI